MPTSIHPTAIVDPGAAIADGVEIGPLAVIGCAVELGTGTQVGSGAQVRGPAVIGENNRIFPYACVGFEPQDLKFKGGDTRLEVGDGNTFREFCTIHRGTEEGGGSTTIGNHNLFMAYSHVAHDCHVGNRTIFSNSATLAGHVAVQDDATVGAFSAVHQFCRVGQYAYIGGYSVITKDALPWVKTVGQKPLCYGVNTIGLRRHGFSEERIQTLESLMRTLLRSGLNTSQALEKLESDFPRTDDVDYLLEFLKTSERGVITAHPGRRGGAVAKLSNGGEDLRIGVVGTGALGRHHVRILSELEGADLVGLFDTDQDVALAVASEFGIRSFDSLESMAEKLEACVVAVPTVDHADVGCYLLEQDLDVLVEKPLATDLAEADRLISAADGKILAVGHVEFYNPAVQRLLDLGGKTGFLEVHRLAVFSPRSLDIDVVLDLMIHDLQILHSLDDSPVAEIRAKGIAVLSDRIDIANARVALESGCVANLTASRVSAERVRKLRVFKPEQGYYSLDYQDQEIKGFRIAEAGGQRQILPDSLTIDRSEPLKEELRAFVSVCKGEDRRVVLGEAGRRALETAHQVLEAIKITG